MPINLDNLNFRFYYRNKSKGIGQIATAQAVTTKKATRKEGMIMERD